MMSRIEFSPKVKLQIQRDCWNQCVFPGCNRFVLITKITEVEYKLGYFQGKFAHIYLASKDPRYDEKVYQSHPYVRDLNKILQKSIENEKLRSDIEFDWNENNFKGQIYHSFEKFFSKIVKMR